jgi:hypothetical protein
MLRGLLPSNCCCLPAQLSAILYTFNSQRAALIVILMDPTRTTLNIVWSCLATIVACVWVALHPGIPQPRSSLVNLFIHTFEKPYGALTALIAPEIVLVSAVFDWLQMKESLRSIRRRVAKSLYLEYFLPG